MNSLIFENLTDLIPAMAKVLKQGMLLPFRYIYDSLVKNLSENSDIDDIIQTVGCFAQLFENEPSLIPECQAKVIPFFLQATSFGDTELNRNIAFALATYCEHAPEADV